MIRSIIKLAVVLVIGILVYNLFFGDETEKQQSKDIFHKVGDLGKDAWGLLKAERGKMKEGKYDEAIDKLDGLYTEIRETAVTLKDSEALERLSELEQKRQTLKRELAREKPETYGNGIQERSPTTERVEDLYTETEELMHEMEQREENRTRSPAPY